MSFEWPTDYNTEECQHFCDRVADGTHDSPQEAPNGKKLATSKNIKNGLLDLSTAYTINDSDFHAINKRSKVDQWDILISMIGTVGEVCIVNEKNPDFAIKNVGLLKISDPVKSRWLYYFLRSPYGKRLIDDHKKGSTQQYISLTELRRLPIPVPKQRKVMESATSILTLLDDRIALLRETNSTLEAIAQAIFKSWFVDFDPVHAKAEGRLPEGIDEETAALFPDGFEESELGPIPRGWMVQTLGDICSVTIGGLWGKDTKEEADLLPVVSLRGVDLENLRSIGYAKDAPVRWVKSSAMEKRRVNECEVLIASSGAGPCGRPLWAGANFESIYGKPVIFSNFVKRLRCETSAKAIYVDRLLADMRESKEIWNFINGTSIPNLDDKLLLASKTVVLPSDGALLAFESIARVIYSKLYTEKAQTLIDLRDTLLPRLISGKLRLPEAKAIMDKVI
ncbi:MAG TPA: restriction endonuclease subunit S [Halothiobacillus sp.]|nr:restriction endonuclease subunit S [Halothiobacillus sp.]